MELPGTRSNSSLRYRPRNAAASPLYRLVLDHLEEYLLKPRLAADKRPVPHPVIERSFRSFLECGIHRFGIVRFQCKKCGTDLFVAFSCKRRGVCPSCDAKRAVAGVAWAVDNLLPRVPYRQWVLVVPKRLRYFIHRNPNLAGEVSRIFAREIELHLSRKSVPGYPAQMHFIQRFGECLNLHVHIHAVVSDGVFSSPGLLLGPRLLFHEATQPTDAEISRLTETIRRKILKRFSRLGIIPKETVSGMLAWPNSGFSLHAKVAVNSQDREGLERLLRYCARPALSIKRLSYHPEKNFAVYRTDGRDTGKPRTLYIEPVEFLRRFALLAPPPNKNTVRYYGALGPNAPLRPLLVKEAQNLSGKENRACKIPALRKVAVLERAKEGLRAATRSWAACLARVFEVEPLKCGRCSGELVPMAAILADRELERLLAYLELPTELPKTAPARSPPFDFGEEEEPESQVNLLADLHDGIDGRAFAAEREGMVEAFSPNHAPAGEELTPA